MPVSIRYLLTASLLLGCSLPALAQPETSWAFEPPLQAAQAPVYQFQLTQATSTEEWQIATGNSPVLAGGLSLALPGAGQFYNSDYLFGGLYMAAALGITIAGFATQNRVIALAGLPAISVASALHAGLQTQELTVLRF